MFFNVGTYICVFRGVKFSHITCNVTSLDNSAESEEQKCHNCDKVSRFSGSFCLPVLYVQDIAYC